MDQEPDQALQGEGLGGTEPGRGEIGDDLWGDDVTMMSLLCIYKEGELTASALSTESGVEGEFCSDISRYLHTREVGGRGTVAKAFIHAHAHTHTY